MWDWLAENGGVILSTAAASGIIVTALNQAANTARNRRKNTRDATYLALRLATELEHFAQKCHRHRVDLSNFCTSEGANGRRTAELPLLPEYPADGDGWRALTTELADKTLSFRLLVHQSSANIDFAESEWWEDGEKQALEELALRAHDAMAIAGELRKRYGLGGFASSFDLRGSIARNAERVRAEREAEKEQDEAPIIFIRGQATPEETARADELITELMDQNNAFKPARERNPDSRSQNQT